MNIQKSNKHVLEDFMQIISQEYNYELTVDANNIAYVNDFYSQIISAVRTTICCHFGESINLVFYNNKMGWARDAREIPHGNDVAYDEMLLSLKLIAKIPTPPNPRTWKMVVCWLDLVERETDLPSIPPKKWLLRAARRWPIVADAYRQRRFDQKNTIRQTYLESIRKKRIWCYTGENPQVKEGTVLFALYWADIGGAESFAVNCIRVAKLAGHRVVVCLENESRRRLFDKIHEYADAIYSFGDFGTSQSKDQMAWTILNREKPSRIHIHHSWVFYRILPHIRSSFPSCRILDTTHIFEHARYDFVMESANFSDFVDLHHVISKSLQKVYSENFKINKSKVIYAPLSVMSRNILPNSEKWKNNINRINITFIGRFSEQKRPLLFLYMASRIKRIIGRNVDLHFTMMGEGELKQRAIDFTAKLRMKKDVSFVSGTSDVKKILYYSHIIIIPSENEGLTLVAMEAIRANCLVISCDVGAQNEIVADKLLISRYPFEATKQVIEILQNLVNGKLLAQEILNEQRSKMQALDEGINVNDFVTQFYS